VPYQRIVKDGIVIQEGDTDTLTKFAQLTQGIDFTGKTVLDCGCNTGMLGYLTLQQGAKQVTGIDIDRDVIKQARSIFPELTFRCEDAEDVYGYYDIIIASGMLHYIKDLDHLFSLFARCTKQVICDLWICESPDAIFTSTYRNIFIPSIPAFCAIAGRHFSCIQDKGVTISPDSSLRHVFHLSGPKPTLPEAILIYGPGGTGKTTLAQTYFSHKHLMTDNLSAAWRNELTRDANKTFSAAYYANLVRGHYLNEYLDFFISTLHEWLTGCVNRDIVIEGYELSFFDFKLRAADLLRSCGWTSIKEINKESL